MNILIFDTATAMEIAVASTDKAVSDQTKKIDKSHSVTFFDSIDLVLKEVNIEIKDINLIGVGIGPGSFTGIRIAVTTARMFAQLFEIPLVGVKTHLIYAASAVDAIKPGENILIAFDAKKSRVFGALYTKGENSNLVELVQPGDYSIEYLLKKINSKEKTLLVGDGCEKYYTEIKSKISLDDTFFDYKPAGKNICDLVRNIYLASPDNYRDINNVIPFYSRKSDAEIIKEAKDNL